MSITIVRLTIHPVQFLRCQPYHANIVGALAIGRYSLTVSLLLASEQLPILGSRATLSVRVLSLVKSLAACSTHLRA